MIPLPTTRSILSAIPILAIFIPLIAGSATAQDEPVLRVLQEFHEDGQFDGSALVYEDGKQIIRQGFGLANIEEGLANTPDTRFDIASITKAFTATLALRLVQDGKWKLTDPIGKYLPEITAPEVGAVTLQQLLEHTSGIGRDHTEYFPSSRQDLAFADLIQVLNSSPLLFEPGAHAAYSNSGYVLLRYAIEKTSGNSFEQVLRSRILEPLGMKSTGILAAIGTVENLARGYSTWLITEPYPGRRRQGAAGDMLGAGALYSTVDDLWRFVQGIQNRKILDDDRVALLWPPEDPGLGWEILQIPVGEGDTLRVVLTTGASPDGFLSAVAWLPTKNSGYVVLSNNEAPGRAGFPSLLIQMEAALQGQTDPPKLPETPIRDVLNALFTEGIDAALRVYRTLERPADTRARADAAQATGGPDAPPGETPQAWASFTPNDRSEWLELWYDPAIEPTELRVYETQVPGAIKIVELRSLSGKKTRIDTKEMTQTVSDKGVTISVLPLAPGSAIEYLTLHLDAAEVPGWTQIDAVGLVDASGQTHWATGARASSIAADDIPPPIHAYPSSYVLERVARAYKKAGRTDDARLILAFLGRLRKESPPL